MQISFEELKKKLQKYEQEPRSFCYYLALERIEESKKASSRTWLLEKKTIESVLLIEFTWNYASPITKRLTKKKVRDVLKENTEELELLETHSLAEENILSRKIGPMES